MGGDGGLVIGGDGWLVIGGGDGGVTVSVGGIDVPAQAIVKTNRHKGTCRINDLTFTNANGGVIIGSRLRALEVFERLNSRVSVRGVRLKAL